MRITKIDLPQQVRDSVFDRMRATFKAQAAKLRAEGIEVSERTRAEANKQQTEILADAAKQAAQIRGEGDASASEVYAKSYSKNAEFYSFYRSMQSYRESVGTPGRRAGRRLRTAPTSSTSNNRSRNISDGVWGRGWRLAGVNWRDTWAGPSRSIWCLEGVLPFLNPGAAQRLMARLAKTEPPQLRWGGLISMVAGLALLWMARNG